MPPGSRGVALLEQVMVAHHLIDRPGRLVGGRILIDQNRVARHSHSPQHRPPMSELTQAPPVARATDPPEATMPPSEHTPSHLAAGGYWECPLRALRSRIVSRGPTRRVRRLIESGAVRPELLRAAEHEADLLAHPLRRPRPRAARPAPPLPDAPPRETPYAGRSRQARASGGGKHAARARRFAAAACNRPKSRAAPPSAKSTPAPPTGREISGHTGCPCLQPPCAANQPVGSALPRTVDRESAIEEGPSRIRRTWSLIPFRSQLERKRRNDHCGRPTPSVRNGCDRVVRRARVFSSAGTKRHLRRVDAGGCCIHRERQLGSNPSRTLLVLNLDSP